MNDIILENDLIKLIASKNKKAKSLVNFDIWDKASNKILFEIYSENDNLTDGNIKIKIKYFENENITEQLKSGIKIFTDFCFICWPLKNIYYETYQNDIITLNALRKVGFIVEADLKNDFYCEGKYISRLILTLRKN